METTYNSVKVKLGIKVIKLVESLISWEVTGDLGDYGCLRSCQIDCVDVSEVLCVPFKKIYVILHSWEGYFILLNKIPVSTIKLPEWRFQAFHKVSLFE